MGTGSERVADCDGLVLRVSSYRGQRGGPHRHLRYQPNIMPQRVWALP
jgi:hypothetical protein